MNKGFDRTIEKIRENCGRVLLAVSGGIDSICMAELFAEAGMTFGVAHCNFRLRGEESDGDEELVRGWAEGHQIEFHLKRFDTEGYASGNGISIEMAARELRYQWFAQLCEEYGYDAVAVAHNANDNAETLMLNLLRGAGMNGLCGMSLFSRIPVRSADGKNSPILLRPLLQFTRKQIEGYMLARRLPYRNDSTNDSSEYKRNRLRNEVFPVFETINPSFIRTFNREMSNFAEAGEIVSDYCEALVPSLVSRRDDGTVRIDLETLKARRHWRYLLYFILEPYGFNSATLGSIEDLLDSSRTASGKSFSSAAYSLSIERKEMILNPLNQSPKKESSANPQSDQIPESDREHCRNIQYNTGIMPIRTAGTYHFNGRTIKVELIKRTADMPLKQAQGTLIMDAAELRFPFVLRTWRSGDWLIPLGMKGKKKVSDLFTDLKYDSLQKKSAVVVIDTTTADMAESQHIAALTGERIDNRYKVDDRTRSIIRISISS